ncbi:MAG: DUF1844 domain-containing protein [Planctomycetes bacterium]|nr:DUF1844 domain-containing protein [Planctomycetota bacterium]
MPLVIEASGVFVPSAPIVDPGVRMVRVTEVVALPEASTCTVVSCVSSGSGSKSDAGISTTDGRTPSGTDPFTNAAVGMSRLSSGVSSIERHPTSGRQQAASSAIRRTAGCYLRPRDHRLPDPYTRRSGGPVSDAETPKLHVDSDWKAQAQAEKERLSKQEAEKAPKGGREEMPPADFRSLVGILASQAVNGLGGYADEQGRVMVDLVGSRFAIDLLAVVEEKTKGNLTPEEAKDLKEVLAELRSRFVQIAQAVAARMASGQGVPTAPAGATPMGRAGEPPAGPKLVVP